MMLAIVKALHALGGSATLHEIDEQVANMEDISEEEQAIMPERKKYRKFNYYLIWCRTYLKDVGALENSSRGVWTLTEKGKAIRTIDQVKTIYDDYKSMKKKAKDEKRKHQKHLDLVENEEDSEQEETTDWQTELLDILLDMEPDAFERLAQRLLREAGFTKVEVCGKSGDGGIDGVGVLRVNLLSFPVYFQCKRWKKNVGAKDIRDFRGALDGRGDKGFFITTSNFTSQASEEATRDGASAIDLIDGKRLCELLKQYGLGIKTEMIENVTVTNEWFKEI